MKLLVTGSTGLVGSACVELFTEKGWDVIGIDNNNRAATLGTPTKHIKAKYNIDFTKADAVFKLFSENKFDAIIHAGAQPSHDWSKDHVIEDFMTNAFGTVILLEATRMFCPEATFLYVSTDKVYGENMVGGGLSDENLGLDFAGSRSPFGCSKASADMYVQEYGNYFGMKTACFRPGCITGKNHEGAKLHGFMSYLVKCIKGIDKDHLYYDIIGYGGKQVRDQIHVNDLANAFWHFIQNPKVAAVYNIGGGPERSVSVLSAIELIQKELEMDQLPPEDRPAMFRFIDDPRKGDRLYDVHDVSKFRKDYPEWDYKYSLQDIVKDLV